MKNMNRSAPLIIIASLLWMNTVCTQASARNNDDLKSLQALTYLQGYNPPPKFSNVTLYDRKRSFEGYNLLVSAHAPEAYLLDMNGRTVHQWRYSSAALPVDHRYGADYWTRARILNNGDLLALIPFRGLLKIDKRSRLIWFKRMFCHHDFDTDSDGNIYILTAKDLRLKDGTDIKNNLITELSPDGKIKKRISLYDLFKKYHDPAYIERIDALGHTKDFFYSKSGIKILVPTPGDAFHANSIQDLDGKWASVIPAFKKGNLLISIRNLGVLICVDPGKEEISWLIDKPFWNEGQHFARLLDNGNIMLFDNYARPDQSRVVEFDPARKRIVWEYSDPRGKFFSSIIGECRRLPNGNTLITESVNGHSFEVTPDKKIVWEFYNPHRIDSHDQLFQIIKKTQHLRDEDNGLIAVTYQMQRIPVGPALDWLNN